MKNAYKKFGYYYDEIMAQLNYDYWLEFTLPYLKKGDTVLDLACGTGTLCNMLTLKGFSADGLDLSETIIEIANEKKKVNRMNINYYIADMTNFKLDKKYDCITCFFDSINFIKEKKDVLKMLDCVSKHLKDNGYFLCDIFSKEMLKEYEENLMVEDYETFKIHWETKKIDSRTLKHNITIEEDKGDSFNETYYEYYHEIKDLSCKKLKLIKVVGDFNDDLQDEDERILLVFQKN